MAAAEISCFDFTCDPSLKAALWGVVVGLPSGPGAGLRGSALRRRAALLDDRFLDLTQPVLAEKHLVADEEGRRAKRATRHRPAGVVDQPLLDVVLPGAGDQAIDVDAGGEEGVPEDGDVIHLLRRLPHVMV